MEAETLTLTALLKAAAAAHPSRRVVVVHGKIDLTPADLDALVDAAVARLSAGADGVRPGQTVALYFPNTVELVITFLAVIRARGVAAPLNPAYTQEEFEFYLSDSEARLLVTNAEETPPRRPPRPSSKSSMPPPPPSSTSPARSTSPAWCGDGGAEVRLLVTNAEGNVAAQAATAKLGLVHASTTTLLDPAGPLHLVGLVWRRRRVATPSRSIRFGVSRRRKRNTWLLLTRRGVWIRFRIVVGLRSGSSRGSRKHAINETYDVRRRRRRRTATDQERNVSATGIEKNYVDVYFCILLPNKSC